jgi:hypothetical protein
MIADIASGSCRSIVVTNRWTHFTDRKRETAKPKTGRTQVQVLPKGAPETDCGRTT